jgi:hypothetical protein
MKSNIGFTEEERHLVEIYARDQHGVASRLGFYAFVLVPIIIYGGLGVYRRDFLPLLAALLGLLIFFCWRLSTEFRLFKVYTSIFQKVLQHEKAAEAIKSSNPTETHIDDAQKQLPFDEKLAASYVGKYVLIGLTYKDHLGNETNQEQMHGVIESASVNGVQISLRGTRAGTTWNSPPLLDAIRPAKPGNYTLSTTNETIENPDLLCNWIITSPKPMKTKPS